MAISQQQVIIIVVALAIALPVIRFMWSQVFMRVLKYSILGLVLVAGVLGYMLFSGKGGEINVPGVGSGRPLQASMSCPGGGIGQSLAANGELSGHLLQSLITQALANSPTLASWANNFFNDPRPATVNGIPCVPVYAGTAPSAGVYQAAPGQ
ncbi:MAG: hypothetical protein PW790_09530 [Parvibaculaceae bacterium]|nr:hypothetical protein [Parvibaculaceae bacterium]